MTNTETLRQLKEMKEAYKAVQSDVKLDLRDKMSLEASKAFGFARQVKSGQAAGQLVKVANCIGYGKQAVAFVKQCKADRNALKAAVNAEKQVETTEETAPLPHSITGAAKWFQEEMDKEVDAEYFRNQDNVGNGIHSYSDAQKVTVTSDMIRRHFGKPIKPHMERDTQLEMMGEKAIYNWMYWHTARNGFESLDHDALQFAVSEEIRGRGNGQLLQLELARKAGQKRYPMKEQTETKAMQNALQAHKSYLVARANKAKQSKVYKVTGRQPSQIDFEFEAALAVRQERRAKARLRPKCLKRYEGHFMPSKYSTVDHCNASYCAEQKSTLGQYNENVDKTLAEHYNPVTECLTELQEIGDLFTEPVEYFEENRKCLHFWQDLFLLEHPIFFSPKAIANIEMTFGVTFKDSFKALWKQEFGVIVNHLIDVERVLDGEYRGIWGLLDLDNKEELVGPELPMRQKDVEGKHIDERMTVGREYLQVLSGQEAEKVWDSASMLAYEYIVGNDNVSEVIEQCEKAVMAAETAEILGSRNIDYVAVKLLKEQIELHNGVTKEMKEKQRIANLPAGVTEKKKDTGHDTKTRRASTCDYDLQQWNRKD